MLKSKKSEKKNKAMLNIVILSSVVSKEKNERVQTNY